MICGEQRNAGSQGCGADGLGDLGKQPVQGLPARSQLLWAGEEGKEVLLSKGRHPIKTARYLFGIFTALPALSRNCSYKQPFPIAEGCGNRHSDSNLMCAILHQAVPRNYQHWFYFLLWLYDPIEIINASKV